MWGSPVTGSGVPATQERSVSDFDAIELRGVGALTVSQTGTESLVIEADDNLLEHLTTEVRDRRLILGTRKGVNLHARLPLRYRVTVRELRGLDVSGSGSIEASDIATTHIIVAISGSGSITIAGQGERQELAISGSGNYDAADFATATTAISVSGSGSAIVHARDTLDIAISGSGRVEYLGEPAITRRISGSGTIRRR